MAYRFDPRSETAFRLCTRSMKVARHYDPQSAARGSDYCEIMEWEGPGALKHAMRRFQVACKYGDIYPSKKRGRRAKQRRRSFRGGTIELTKIARDGTFKKIASCKRPG